MRAVTFSVMISFFLQAFTFGQTREYLYCGTYSVRGSKGVYIFSFDRQKGKFELKGTVHSLNDPTYLEISADKRYLYTANRQALDTSANRGSVTSYSINPNTGLLTEISRSSSYGNSPCHIQVSHDGKWLFASHYKDGSLTVLSTDGAGRITGLADSVIHRGSSIHANQLCSHAHSTNFIPGSDFFITADLGSDKLWVHQWENGRIARPVRMTMNAVPGSGPRHFDFYKSWVFVAEELSSTVSVYEIDPPRDFVRRIQRISTLPESFQEANAVADIHLSPDHKFLYVSNRGHNSLAIFRVNEVTGKLTLIGHQTSLGKTPRNFCMDPSGEFLLVANQDSDDVFFFRRNKESGLLQASGEKLSLPSPVCLKIVKF